ncbi:MAG: hypothetical protein HY865_20870 [Chloroflexi bacterium]|nr:hypothetical protein [Chloroflexota bacterium]
MKSVLEYRDASNLPDAAERADHLPELKQALEAMGFRHLGYVEERVPGASAQGGAIFMEKGDADYASRLLADGHITEVMTDPSGIALVELERFFESELLQFRTIFENGVVVETSIRPQRLPEHRDMLQPLRDALEAKPIQKFLNWTRGNPPWVTSHRPAAGYHFEAVDNPTPREIWERHKQRVADVAKKQRARIPPHNYIRLLFAMVMRKRQISQFQEKFASRGEIVVVAILLLVLALFFILVGGTFFGYEFETSREIGMGLGISTFFIALLGVAWGQRVTPLIVRWLPFPRLQSLRELLDTVKSASPAGETVFRREFENDMEAASIMAVVENVMRLKQLLQKEEKSILQLWTKRWGKSRSKDPQKILRVHQRYERLLLAELKLRGLPSQTKTDWGKFILKWITATVIGVTMGWLWKLVDAPTYFSSGAFVIGMLFSWIGIAVVDEFFGYIIFVAFYMSRLDHPYAVWGGIGFGVAFAVIWHFFIRRSKFKKALRAVKNQYDL